MGLAAALVLGVIIFSASAQALLAFMDRNAYEINETAIVKVNRTQNINITGIVSYSSNSTQIDNFTIANGSAGMVEYSYAQTLPAGEYALALTESSDEVQIGFEVANEILKPVVRLMGAAEPIFIDTSTEVNNETGGVSGNFTELLVFNLSATILYGEYDNLTGDDRNFSFVVVDEKASGVYDVVYVDDDRVFQLFNDTEDTATKKFTETVKGPGDMLEIDENNRYIIADINTTNGKGVYMIVPLSSPAFSSSDTLHMAVLVMDKNGNLYPNKSVNISVMDDSKTLKYNTMVSIGSDGYANISLSLSSYTAGKYLIAANETPVDVFRVESFKLHGKVTDLSDNPSYAFAPNSKAKIWAVARDANGDLMALSSVPTGTLTMPDGSTAALSFSAQAGATGVYTAETTSALTATGEYKVIITGTKSSDTEKFDMGFRVQSIEMMLETVNPKYIDEGGGPGTMISAFAPGSNVTAIIFMINATKGSAMKSGGPPCGFDGSGCVQVSCASGQFDVLVKDEKGSKHSLNSSQFSTMTISQLASRFNLEPPEEPGMEDQCALMIWDNNTWISNAGNYKAEIRFSNASVGDLDGGASFSIKKLLAQGSTVDFKGDSFSFFAPNSTVRVKLEIRNLATDELLQSGDILNAKFTEMWKEWPESKNALTEMSGFNKTTLNESMDGDTIVFTSPPEEGFYMAEFRFQANMSGEILEGTGNIFFELKKYMIWADLDSVGEGNWYVKVGQNISLSVTIMDIDMGSQYGKGTAASCTGCTGLVANISSLRNEQFFKEMVEGTDYSITTGVVTNSTSGATITIEPTNLPSGWYGVDVKLQSPDGSDTYYGWGWFEIRNFWVDVFEVEESGGNYSKPDSGEDPGGGGPGGGTTVPVGGNVLLGVAAYSPPTKFSPPTPLTVSAVDTVGMQNFQVWPPLPVSASKYSIVEIGSKNITECWGDYCEEFPIYVINLTIANDTDESSYELSLDVTAAGAGSDIGTARVTVASYVTSYVSSPLTKMFEWPPVYATTENLTLIFSATDFDGGPYNITNITVGEVFSESGGRPVRFKFGQNYTNNCTGTVDSCNLTMFLSGLSSGEYFAVFEIVDASGSKQNEEYEFEIRNLLFSVPKIYEGWTMEQSTPEKTIDAWNGEDSCNNEMWLNDDSEPASQGHISIYGGASNITFPQKNTSQSYYWVRMCLRASEGRLEQAGSGQSSCQEGGEFIYMVSNATNVWLNETSDLNGSEMLTNGSTFVISNYSGFNWSVDSIGEGGRKVQLKHAGGTICSRNEVGSGDGTAIKIIPPAEHVNYSSFYHGPTYIVGDMWEGNWPREDSIEGKLNVSARPVYIYHNTTHLWLHKNLTNVDFTNSSNTNGPYAAGDTAEDGYGGNWTVVSISKSQISLNGQNILSNGIMVNTSLSTSGNIYVGELRENEMGFENKFSEVKQGLDLDGDGLKNGSLYFLIIDGSNGYNKLAFSNYSEKWNFTETSRIVNTSEPNRLLRQVGITDKLTLLSIDPRASNVKFYDPSATGDWPEMGDSKMGDNVTIPVVVKSPDGSSIIANVSIPNMKVKTSTGVTIVPTGLSAIEINGVGEIRINVSALGYSSGRYEFELKADNGTFGEEMMNEWMWPRTTVRNFLVDMNPGYGGIISDFVQISVDSYGGWDSTVRVRSLETVNESGKPAITGMMAYMQHELGASPACANFAEPTDAGSDTGNKTYVLDRFDDQYYAYMTPANTSMVWLKSGDCNFTTATNYTAGDQVNITLGTDVFMLYILNATIGRGAIGIAGLDSIVVEPIRMSEWSGNKAPQWHIMAINRSGTLYNIIFANDTALNYPQAGIWGVEEVSKAVWIDTDGNFSDASKYVIGDNFTADEHISRLGPGPWEGISIANTSNLSGIGITARPTMDIRVQDNTPAYFGKINESDASLDTDVNMDGDKTDVFYMVAYDEFGDGNNVLTRMYVDDDLNITEPWWANSSNPNQEIEQGNDVSYYEFYGNEEGSMAEQEGSPPTGMWGGNIRFAAQNNSQSWEESASWNTKVYNGTTMILEKNVWRLDKSKTLSLTIKVFDFAQSPVSGANITLEKLMRFGGGQPFTELNASAGEYTLNNVQNTTDSNGFGMIKISPNGTWLDNSEYIAELKIEYGGMEETVKEWFRMGEGGF